jgi:serine/threonine-protein kinase
MGEVYRARDTRLNRDVALKVLPDVFATNAERLARFTREAQTLASLNDARIAHIHGLEESGDVRALVMEFVEGEDLAQRLTRGRIPLDEALVIAQQIAEGLEVAHEQGIVHRDLKPANVKLTPAGAVKILDFGLAKAMDALPSAAGVTVGQLPTITSPAMTAAGVILGTAAYMSPEQARGKAVDRRTDVWAFGCVLYEMLAGRRPFDGEDVPQVLAYVIEREPDWNALPAGTPPSIRRLLKRCLRKDPKERLQAIGDARVEMLDEGADAVSKGRRLSSAPMIAAVAGAAMLGILATWILMRGSPPSQPASIARVLLGVNPADRLLSGHRRDAGMNLGRPSRTSMVFSKDGRSIVFSGERNGRVQLYLRHLDQTDAMPIAGTEGAINPFLSPDGQSVGFYADGALKRVPLDGGPVIDICKTDLIYGAAWARDEIVFALQLGALSRVSANGGQPMPATTLQADAGELNHRLPQMLPDGTTVLFTALTSRFPSWDDTLIVAQSLATGRRKVLVEGGADARYVETGHLVFLRRGTLMAVPFDLKRLEVTGTPIGLVADVMQSANVLPVQLNSGAGQFAVSSSGSLVYATGGMFPQDRWTLVWVDRTGKTETLQMPPAAYAAPRLSPDGRRIAYHTTSGDWDLWTYDLSRGIAARIALAGQQSVPIWTPDGSRLTFASMPKQTQGLFLISPDGTGSPEFLAAPDGGGTLQPNAWTADGRTLAFSSNRDLWVMSRDQNTKPRVAVSSTPPLATAQADFSSDGRWLAYATTVDDSDRAEGQVYVQPYPALDRRERVSPQGGFAPLWSHDGRTLYYLENASADGPLKIRVMAVPVTTAPTFSAGTPRMLFEGRYRINGPFRNWDVTADGQRFLMVQEVPELTAHVSALVFVMNWTEELKRLASGNGR